MRQRHQPLTIGLVIKAVHGDYPEANRFYAPVMAESRKAAGVHRFDLMLATMPVDQHYYPIEVPQIVTNRACDGLIVVGAHLSRATAEILPERAAGHPGRRVCRGRLLQFGRHGQSSAGPEWRSSTCSTGATATSPSWEPSPEPSQASGSGVGDTRRSWPKPGWRRSTSTPPTGRLRRPRRWASRIFRAHPDVTAVFCANDAVAVALLQAARQAGIAVPGRLSVVGFDDIDLAGFVSPGLTTMAVDKVGMGRLAVTLLAHRLELGKECVTQTLVRPTLVLRGSTRVLGTATRPDRPAPELQTDPQQTDLQPALAKRGPMDFEEGKAPPTAPARALPNIPWEDRPAACGAALWRYSRNPIIPGT